MSVMLLAGIKSNENVGSLIYRLRGIDPDGDTLKFGIKDQIGSDILRLEAISSNEANVYLVKELDRETRDEYSFVLTLTDGYLGEGNFVTQSFLLLVEDVNDNEPVFKPYPSAITVREDAEPGILETVEATDLDEGAYGQVLYQLQELDGDLENFLIQTVNGKGVIRLVNGLDYERKSLYQLRVLAVDRANQGRINTGTAAILVKVQDVEDQPPEFIVASPVTRISEDAPIGTSVLQVRAIDGDRGINNRISYSIVSGGEEHFDIDGTSGIIYTFNPLDREDPLNSNGAYILEILATEESQQISPLPSATTEVTIIVTDVNDEIPRFRSEQYVGEILENAQQNTPITLLQHGVPEVYDYDQGKNGTFDLYLIGDNGVFEVTPFKGVNEASFLIRVNNPSYLDYEKITMMNFTLIAKEVVTKDPKMSIVPITVYIKDENDNFPEFTESLYTVSVPENCGVGTTVAWVQAMDQDSDNYGTKGIRYTNLGGSIAHLLNLNEITGVITVKQSGDGSFDRELISRHYLTVEARDDQGNGNRNTAQLVINIEDVNDNAPMFLANKYEARLLENEEYFENPLIVEARDADLNGTKNRHIEYSIVGGDYKNNFTIDPNLGIITPISGLDFEQIPGDNGNIRPIHLVVKARDFGVPSLSSTVPVTVYVQDVNDHAPMFQQMIYKRSIPEDMPGGTSILEVKARDMDGSSPNNRVVYRIERGAADKFVVQADSGVVAVAQGASLDPDVSSPKMTTYTLTLIAIDGGIGEQQLRAAVLVNITIVDVNNKPPVLYEPGTVSVMENTQVGTVIYRAQAHDPDEQPVLRYTIDKTGSAARNEEGVVVHLSEYDYLTMWDLNPVDGTLKVVRLLDREKIEIVKLMIRVEDMAAIETGPKQTASATLTIVVEDENDNNPKFRKPYYKTSIAENSKNGALIDKVIADDADKNRTMSYFLEGPAELLELVHMERASGELVVNSRVDHEQHSWINLTVKAVDSGLPPRYSVVDLFIQVLDENDNNPVFETSKYEYTIPEDIKPGTAVANIVARDADSGEFGKITYLLDRMSTQGKFLIRAETGTLVVAEPLDREIQGTYNLVVEAWDNYQFGFLSGESRNAFKQIVVHVEDVNDNPPQLKLPNECATVTEFHEQREPVTTVSAIDADDNTTPNGQVTFHLVGGKGHELFRFEHVSGEANTARLFARQSLQDRFGNYSLAVEARDAGHPPPGITGHSRRPFKSNSECNNRYRGGGGEGHRCGYRAQWRSTLRIEAYDLGMPTPLSSDLDLTIYVQNVDNYRPRFPDKAIYINITENVPDYGIILPSVVERDPIDRGDEPILPVCYYIVEGNEDAMYDLDRSTHSEIFTGGITTEADFGIEFMHVKAVDIDEGDNAKISYYLIGDVKETLTEGLENLAVLPYLVHIDTGAVSLNFDPQKGMKGYFDFKVLANDTDGYHDESHVFIYLLREDQRVRFVLRAHPSEIRDKIQMFRETLAHVTQSVVNVDDLRVHENKDGSVDHTKTDLYLHLVNKEDHSVLEVDQVLKLVDNNIEQLDSLFKEFNVLDTQPAGWAALLRAGAGAGVGGVGGGAGRAVYWLVWTALLLAALLALCLVLCLTQRADYVRRLKAATATAYSSPTPGDSDMTIRSTGRVPNTNKHSTKGSNPIWLQAYENDWYKSDEQLSQSERDSLDENAVNQDLASDKPYFITTGAFPSIQSNETETGTNQADCAFYQQLEQMKNAKNMETTEL
ncbi:Cadherin-23 [Papilio xuthus]|uniref:Cadherin-23 n=1 Tax=Papilio xuthus TaxID=66420 RepID=A0A194PHI4_PAPXU|nr:Cadherin-23 [Papilio xuthus]